MEPIFFASAQEFRKWLKKHSSKDQELLVGYYKVGTGRPSMTWSESVDQALCFGWIDGVRRSVDADSYMIRFTPRKPGSIWSAVNIRKMAELQERGLIEPAGAAAFARRKEDKSAIYAYEREVADFAPHFAERLKSNQKAQAYFDASPKSYQRSCRSWVMSAKQEATREKRMNELIADSAAGMKIKSQRW